MTQRDDDERTASDAYLWDKSGAADPFVTELERALSPLAVRQSEPPRLPTRLKGGGARALPLVFTLAACAAFVVLRAEPGLEVEWVEGETQVESTRLVVGGAIETHEDRVAAIDLGAHGIVSVRGRSLVRLVESTHARQELFLERGSLHAIVDAPPRFFTVGTPHARAVDLGCEYTLAVDEASGTTTVVVLSGAVSLEDDDAITIVPAGASARADRGADSLPYATRTTPELRAAAEAGDVTRVVELAVRIDAITLWHIAHTRRDPAALAKLRALVEPPPAADVTQVEGMYAWLALIEADLARALTVP